MPAEPTLGRQLERYLRHVSIERGLSANTVAAYRRDLTPFVEQLRVQGVTEPAQLTTEVVVAYARSLRSPTSAEPSQIDLAEPLEGRFVTGRGGAGLAPASVARKLSSVRGFTRFLVEEGELAVDPAAEIAPPKQTQRLPKALTIDQVEKLLAATDGDEPARLRDKALLELLYATGARVSEAVALNVDDLVGLDGPNEVVRLLGKGNKQRIVPVGSYARAAIEAYLVRARPLLSAKGHATPALFLGVRGSRLSRQNAWLIIRAAAERAQLDVELSPHSLRHSFATHLLAGGADVRVVQELLGHASVATTQLYTLVTADALRDVYQTSHPRAR